MLAANGANHKTCQRHLLGRDSAGIGLSDTVGLSVFFLSLTLSLSLRFLFIPLCEEDADVNVNLLSRFLSSLFLLIERSFTYLALVQVVIMTLEEEIQDVPELKHTSCCIQQKE